jgi:hypothetical protein
MEANADLHMERRNSSWIIRAKIIKIEDAMVFGEKELAAMVFVVSLGTPNSAGTTTLF